MRHPPQSYSVPLSCVFLLEVSKWNSLTLKIFRRSWGGNDTFSKYTFQTWVEAIPREQRQKLRLPSKILPISVIIYARFKACKSPNWLLSKARDVINVVEMQDP